uniref:THAP-type domain-containing protein n=1 Tax=Scylla olivacea TaxID=85551 RepID=A0A0N7ZCT3_SCYOL
MPRGSTCKAKGCTSNKNDNPELSFHSFPRNKERFKLWCELIKRPDLNHGKAISSRMSMRVCSLHFEDHMYMSPTNKSRLIWCAVPKPVEIKVSEREEKAPVASLLPELDANEKSYSYSSCPEDIIIKEESVMDEDSCDDVSPPSYCPESSSAEILADSKVGILEHSQSGQCVREGADSKSRLDNPESGQALCSAKTEILGPVTDASVSFDSLVLPPDDTFEIISIQEKNVCSLKEDVIDGPRKPVKEMDSNQDSIMCISSEPLNSGSQMDKTNSHSSRLSLPIDSSTTSETKITISNVKKVSLSHNLANASSQSQPKSTSSQSSISPSKSFSVSQLNAPNNCSIVLQEFPSKHQSKLFNSDSTEPFADTISMKENFCEKLEVNEETINERKSKCGEDCGCDKCFAAAEVMKATSRRTYSGPIRRQIVRTKSGAKRTIMIVKKASLKNLRAKGLIQPIGKKCGYLLVSIDGVGVCVGLSTLVTLFSSGFPVRSLP